MKKDFIKIIEKRRSIYALNKNIPITNEQVEEIVSDLVLNVPSAFNSESARVVLLFGDKSDKVWDITKNALKAVVPAESFSETSDKIDSFAAGAGTILFFEDYAVIEGLQENFALYADNFPIWSNNSAGMLQFSVWSTLADNGIGASLQHYNPLIDDDVKKEFDLPSSWKLVAQMPFGGIAAPAGEKTSSPAQSRVKVIK